MAVRRSLVRSWRRLRRPTLGRLVSASLALHLVVGLTLLAWLARGPWQVPPPSRAPLIVELPPAEPGPPLVRPETPRSRGSAARPAPRERRASAPSPTPPAPPNVVKPPEAPPQPVPPASVAPPPAAPAPPAPPTVARAPESPPPPRPEPAPAPQVSPSPGPPAVPAEPTPPSVATRPPEAGVAAPARPVPAVPPAEPSESPFAGRRFSLLTPKLEVPPLPPLPAPSGRGGTRSDGAGAGESGTESEGQIAVPLNTPDPRYAAYFTELKRRIEEKWVYPQEAARNGQSGQGELRFVLRKDGSVRTVEIVSSSGVRILDRYIEFAIRQAEPFPPIPASVGEDLIPISINFTYVLGGFRLFGFR